MLEYTSREEDGTVEIAVIIIDGVLSSPVEVTVTPADGTATG